MSHTVRSVAIAALSYRPLCHKSRNIDLFILFNAKCFGCFCLKFDRYNLVSFAWNLAISTWNLAIFAWNWTILSWNLTNYFLPFFNPGLWHRFYGNMHLQNILPLSCAWQETKKGKLIPCGSGIWLFWCFIRLLFCVTCILIASLLFLGGAMEHSNC